MTPDFAKSFPLRRARVHEVCGPSAASFAAVCAARSQSTVLWIREAWRAENLNPLGLTPFFDPVRLLVAQVKDQVEGLAVAEEALRDGSTPLVIQQISEPMDLIHGRRLQLSAKAGKSTGLCIIPDGMGSNAAESRWHCTPIFDPFSAPGDSTLQRWELIKNKSGTLGSWHVRWDAAARRLNLVSQTRE
ncbi:ImuA family protein [Planktotalea sp.]|uniref:ImuA family protein n=1 Tax=Planktotalea sp. TaxID=2029877 RepID=UPI003D6B987A